MPADRTRHVPRSARLPEYVCDPVDDVHHGPGRPHRRGISQEGWEDVSDLVREDGVEERLLRSGISADPAIIPEIESNEARVDTPSIPFDAADSQPGLSECQARVVI